MGRATSMHSRWALCAGAGWLCALSLAGAGCRSSRPPARPAGGAGSAGSGEQGAPSALASLAYSLSPAHTHKNLTIFLIRGRDTAPGRKFLTLQEALEQKKVVVHETEDVNELVVENRSDEEVFINSGDIVKGGKQDRCFGHDVLLPPGSGKVKAETFCVERGRWSQRGAEAAGLFGSSYNMIAGRPMKLAVTQSAQDKVWSGASDVQGMLNTNAATLLGLPTTVASQDLAIDFSSPTSLQLTLENANVKAMTEPYVKELAGVLEGQGDVIGFACAINGKVVSADIYASNELFRKLWPKLLEASAVEAAAEYRQDQTFPAVSDQDVRACLAGAGTGPAHTKDNASGMKVEIRQADRHVQVEASDRSGAVLHLQSIGR